MKFALICGASGNIGTAISKDLAKKGWSLYLHYYQNEATTNQLANELRAEYPQQDFLTIQANFRSEDAAQKISQNIFGLNAVVFAQGTTIYQLFDCFSAQQLENLWQEQLKTPMLVIQKVIKKISNAENGATQKRICTCCSLGWEHILESPNINAKGISSKARVIENMVTNQIKAHSSL